VSTSEYDYEPVPGLPASLPAGETLLWQGSPRWWSLAKYALRVRIVAAYFLAIALWQVGEAVSAGRGARAVLHAATLPLLLGAGAVLMLGLIAWAAARATMYSLTNRRIVIRHGIALPMSLNLPFAQIDSASLRLCRDGSGEVALRLPKRQRVGYLLNWPHVRPGHYMQPQPALRGLADPEQVARILGEALQAASGGASATPRLESEAARVAMSGSHASAAA
jgi:hypothetical protein